MCLLLVNVGNTPRRYERYTAELIIRYINRKYLKNKVLHYKLIHPHSQHPTQFEGHLICINE